MVTLGTGRSVPAAEATEAAQAAKSFTSSIDQDGDNLISNAEIEAANTHPDMTGAHRTLEELVSFHDVNRYYLCLITVHLIANLQRWQSGC